MRVRAETCWNGNDTFSVRLTILSGACYGASYRVPAPGLGEWSRSVATDARDLLETETGVRRDSIKIEHR